jgi:integrase/recombinase XerD
MKLFKKTSSAWTLNGARVPKGTPGALLTRTQSQKWYVSIDKKHVPLSPNKRIAEELAAQLLGKKAAGELNLKTRNDDEARKPLLPLVTEWTAALVLKGTTEAHVAILKARVNKVLSGCDFARARDFDAGRALRFVSALTVGETGRAASLQTKNFHIAALKQFARWLVKRGTIAANPFADLEGWNVKLDRKHDRRELTESEIGQLLTTTEREGKVRWHMPAADRAMLYRVALCTGFRASELDSLTPAGFDLEAGTVTVAAGYTKNRTLAVQPLPSALVPLLRVWLEGKDFAQPCWPGTWAKTKAAGKMLRADLTAAGVAYEVGGQFADFHSLRHSYISRVVRSGVNPRLAQSLARHSTITLTMNRYAHVEHGERRAAVAGLSVPGCKQDANRTASGTNALENEGDDEPATGLENRRHASVRGFESLPFR